MAAPYIYQTEFDTVSEEEEWLDKNYAGEEENYIMDMFGYKEEDLRDGTISWDWFVGIYDYTDDEYGLDMPDIEKLNKI